MAAGANITGILRLDTAFNVSTSAAPSAEKREEVKTTIADRLFDAKVEKKGDVYKLCLFVKDPTKINYEEMIHSYSIIVGVMDEDNLTAEIPKTINIVDVNEMPVIWGSLTFSFYEGKGKDYVIGRLDPEDIDTSKVFRDNVFLEQH